MTATAAPERIGPVSAGPVRGVRGAARPAPTRRPARSWPLWRGLAPAVVAAVAYVDPGNVATNMTAGALQGYRLVWVVLAASGVAMLVQSLSAKLGLATGSSLAELCRLHLAPRLTQGLWVQAELVAIATDLAEVVGGAVALNLLFGLPLVQGAVITAVVAVLLMQVHQRRGGGFELTIAALFAVILLGFLVSAVAARPDAGATLAGAVPSMSGAGALPLVAGIVGATVMPHAIYLHSALTAGSHASARRELRQHRRGIAIALGTATVINVSMLLIAASCCQGDRAVALTLQRASAAVSGHVGSGVALLFAIGLLASGFASTGVGTLAGQSIMSGFLARSVPLPVRRLVTLLPPVVVLALGVDGTQALVASQVVLSMGVPFALVPLIWFTRRPELMGPLVNRRSTTAVAWACAALVVTVNVALVLSLLGVL